MLLVHNGGGKKRKEKKGKPFKTHEKKALKCPEGLSGQCFCSSLSQASKEQNPVIAIFHTFYVCVYSAAEVSSTAPEQSWVLLIQSK